MSSLSTGSRIAATSTARVNYVFGQDEEAEARQTVRRSTLTALSAWGLCGHVAQVTIPLRSVAMLVHGRRGKQHEALWRIRKIVLCSLSREA